MHDIGVVVESKKTFTFNGNDNGSSERNQTDGGRFGVRKNKERKVVRFWECVFLFHL